VAAIEKQLYETYLAIRVRLPYQQGQLISLFHEQGQVNYIEHGRGGVRIDGMIPGRLYTRFQPFLVQDPNKPEPTE
jgi:GTPase